MSDVAVGTRLDSVADFDRLPIGTMIGPPGTSEVYTKTPDHRWMGQDGDVLGPQDFTMGYNVVQSLPKNPPTWESLAQWQFRYRDNALTAAEQAGVSTRTVLDAMRELGIDDTYFPLGRGVRVANAHDKDRLPVGSLVARGEPEDVSTFGLFVKAQRGWQHILGDYNSNDGPVEVVSGDPVEWATAPGSEAEQAAIADFKARAWRVGWKVKVANRWCESYETYMGRVGLTDEVLQHATFAGITTNEHIAQAMASRLPEGSLLRWHHRTEPGTFTWYIRDDHTTNVSRTRALFGHRPDGGVLRNSARTMQVMWIANDDEDGMRLRIDNLADIWPYVPVGTRLWTGATEVVVARNHRLNYYVEGAGEQETGPWDISQLVANLTVGRFPS